jgi:hypothetical protein
MLRIPSPRSRSSRIDASVDSLTYTERDRGKITRLCVTRIFQKPPDNLPERDG